MNLQKLIIVILPSFLLLACGGMEKRVIDQTKEIQKGPQSAPTRNITNFSAALRCMDNLMYTHGVKKFSVLAEDLKDNTKRINAGVRDMLITAVSDMTKRSRAIHMIVFGNDSGNLISYLSQAGQQSVYKDIPKYDIRGSISQFDKNVVSQNANAGISIPEAGIGFSTSASGSVLGLDMSMVDTSDMSLVPGVTSRNSIIIVSAGSGGDVDGTIKKAGINFGLNMSKTEGQSQALRNLLELATVELFGKLLKLPYWSCLEIDPKHESIKQEIDDWYFSLSTNDEMVAYVQNQLLKRGYYQGMVDGNASPAYEKSVALFKIDQKLPGTDAKVDKPLFTALLNTPLPKDASSRMAKQPGSKAPLAVVSQPRVLNQTEQTKQTEKVALEEHQDPDETPGVTRDQLLNNNEKSSDQNAIFIRSSNPTERFSPGQQLNLVVRSNRDAYLYCFFLDDNSVIQRVYPNRFSNQSFVRAGQEINLPGEMPFEVTASNKGKDETLRCFSTNREVLVDLPTPIKVLDFVNLDVENLDVIRENFKKVAGNSLGEGSYKIRLQ